MRWAVIACTLAGCFSPGFSDDQLTCESGLCPPGLFCVDGICRQAAGDGDVDASPVTADAAVDAAIDAIPPMVSLFVNINGPAHDGVDFPGSWEEDVGQGSQGACNGSEGGSADLEIQGTVDDPLFRTVMFNGNNLNCSVGQNLPAGEYDVTLLMGEIFFGPNCPGGGGPGSRVFDVRLESDTVDTDLDLFVLNNGCVADPMDADAAPYSVTYRQTITDGDLDVRLQASAGTGLLSAISVVGPIE